MPAVEVSVIIPTYNRETTLPRAIESVLSQTYAPLEVLVVDDGSTDSTEEIVRKYPVKLIKTENQGVSAARNLAAHQSRGTHLAFLDSDDEWLPNRLADQIEILRCKPDLALVHGEEIWIRNGVRVNAKKRHQKSAGRIFANCIPLCVISPSATLLRKDIFLDFGGFDPEFIVCEDYKLWLQICAQYEVGMVEWPIIKKYGGHEDQLSRRFFAMDEWRIRALAAVINVESISEFERSLVLETIFEKTRILYLGYLKRNRIDKIEWIQNFIKSLPFAFESHLPLDKLEELGLK